MVWQGDELAATERTGSTVKIGRKDRGNRWPSVAIKDSAVSQKHVQLRWTDTRWEAVDVGSSNGTSLNGCSLVADGALAVAMWCSLAPVNARSLTMQTYNAVPTQPLKSGDIMTLGDAVELSIEARTPSCKLLLLAVIGSTNAAGMV